MTINCSPIHTKIYNCKKIKDRKMEKDKVIFTKKELWLNQVACWNFELDEDQLLQKALDVGFVSKVGEDAYLVNQDY